MTQRRQRDKRQFAAWSGLADRELLEWRFCDLGLKLANSPVAPDIEHLYATLARRGIAFRPHVWLSSDWFSPDGIPGIAVPFYLGHPRLNRLERRMKGEAEGGNYRWRRRILRHEAGHALDTAYRLRRRPDWRKVFGPASRPYPRDYSARPASRRFVLHLGHWYAQSHPTEDFAETFAVWLQPKASWRRDYAGWPALKKLEYVDALMTEIAGRRPRNRCRSIVAPISANRRSLREHYRRSGRSCELSERRYDPWLRQAFAPRFARPEAIAAGQFLREIEPELKRALMRRTGAGRYLSSHVAENLCRRARELDLVLQTGRREARREALRLYERVVADLLRRNRERYVL